VGLGIGLGILLSKLSWFLLAPAVGQQNSDGVNPRAVASVFTTVSGAIVIFLLDRLRWPASISSDFWSTAVVAYAVPFLWAIASIFERIGSRHTMVPLRAVLRGFDWICFLFLVGLLISTILGGPQHAEQALFSVVALCAIGVLGARIIHPTGR
jgi:hypothetical protein